MAIVHEEVVLEEAIGRRRNVQACVPYVRKWLFSVHRLPLGSHFTLRQRDFTASEEAPSANAFDSPKHPFEAKPLVLQ